MDITIIATLYSCEELLGILKLTNKSSSKCVSFITKAEEWYFVHRNTNDIRGSICPLTDIESFH